MRILLIGLATVFLTLTTVLAQEEKSPWYEYYDVISYSELRGLIDGGDIEEARILNDGWWVTVRKKDGEYLDVRVTPQTPIADHFYDAGIPVRIEHGSKDEDDDTPLWLEVFYNLLPLLIFIVFFAGIMFFMKRSGGGYYARAEQINKEFLDRLEKLLTEQKENNG